MNIAIHIEGEIEDAKLDEVKAKARELADAVAARHARVSTSDHSYDLLVPATREATTPDGTTITVVNEAHVLPFPKEIERVAFRDGGGTLVRESAEIPGKYEPVEEDQP